MGSMTNAAKERFEKAKKRPDVPEWLTPVSLVLFLLFIIFTGFQLMKGNDKAPEFVTEFEIPGGLTSTPGPDGGGTDGEADGSGTSTSEPGRDRPSTTAAEGGTDGTDGAGTTSPPNGLININDLSGTPVVVPAEAADVATRAIKALFTGDSATVPIADGSVAPPAGQTYPDPQVNSTQVRSNSDTIIVFEFLIDPDGAGPQPERRSVAPVILESGRWVWQP